MSGEWYEWAVGVERNEWAVGSEWAVDGEWAVNGEWVVVSEMSGL